MLRDTASSVRSPLVVPVAFDVGGVTLDLEVTAGPAATVSDLVEAVAGGTLAGAPVLRVDGRRVDPDQPVAEVGLRPGSWLSLAGEDVRVDGAAAVVDLRVVGGIHAGATIPLAPGRWTVGRGGSADLDLVSPTVSPAHAVLVVDALGGATIEDLSSHNGTRIEGEFVAPGTVVSLEAGAVVSMGAVDVVLSPVASRAERPDGVVVFNRPPRPAPPPPPPTIEVPEAPADPPARARLPLAALVAPLVMGAVMAVLWDPRMALFALLTPVAMLGSWGEERRRARTDRRRAARLVAAEVARFAEAVDAARTDAVARARRRFPDGASLVRRASTVAADLWERRPVHDDALQLRIGAADVAWTAPLGDVRQPAEGVTGVLADRAVLRSAPFAVDLRPGRVLGVVGDDRDVVASLLRSLVVQAATLHGPADLRIAVLTDDERAGGWAFARWLPHVVGGDVAAVVATISAEEHADRLVVVDADGLTEGRPSPVRSLLAGSAGPVAGIVVASDVRRLPALCTTVLVLEGPDGAGHGVDVATDARTEQVVVAGLTEAAASAAARSLAAVEDPERRDAGASLPDRVGLLAMLGLEPTAAAVADRWRTPSQRAPIGMTEDGPLVVDLVADGPHGLVGGTTGSGKSELLRTLVVGLAASASAAELNFVLIDYKGGSAFDACARLPHTVGLVTDLDEHLGQRALRCLEAELRHRESVLRALGASDVSQCRSLPRLVVVIDEFATLAGELPEFIDALVGIAQRGRSLGVHLLLATQRPAGAVKDNIRANTNLRIALRMQDAADSTDVLDTPVAATIGRHQAGRAFARLGPREVVAFQAAIVSQVSAVPGATAVDRVEVRPLGFGPASVTASEFWAGDGPTDLERLVDAILDADSALGLAPPRRPWPDPLPSELDIGDVGEVAPSASASPLAVLGLADDPWSQTQRPAVWDAASAGNLLLYGVAGSGTTTALLTLARSLAARHRPDRLHLYVADLGAGDLAAAVVDLPHVGAAITAGEGERLRRLVRFLRSEVDRRRGDGRGRGRPTDAPAVVVLVDNWSGFLASFEEDDLTVRDEVERLIADGPAVGVWTVLGADRADAIPLSIAGLIPSKLVFRMADRHDPAALGVPAGLAPAPIPGRCVDTATGLEVQIATSASLSPWPGRRTAATIGVLPTSVTGAEVAGVVGPDLTIGIGIGDSMLEPVALVLRPGDHALVTGPARSGKSTALLAVATVLGGRPGVRVHAVSSRPTSPLRAWLGCVGALEELVLDGDATHVVLVDDAETVDDPLGVVAGFGDHVHVIASGRVDALRSAYGHWTRDLRASRLGIALHPDPEDGELLGAVFPRRRRTWTTPGRGYLVVDGRAELTQVARP